MNVMVRRRNDRAQEWEPEILQEVTEKLDWCYFSVPGTFRTRQIEISFTDDSPFVLIQVEEEVEILGY
jgi:hypothetical protein